MVIANVFQNQPKSSANYTYTDLITGQGRLRLYLMDTSEGDYVLNTAVVGAANQTTQAADGNTVTRTFRSSPVTFPALLTGEAFFTCAFWQTAAVTGTVTATLKIYDGSTSTAITAAHTSSNFATGSIFQAQITLQMALTSDVLIKPGEQYELVVALDDEGGPGAGSVRFSHDPIGRDDDFSGPETVSTVAFIDIPLRIDL